MKNKNTLIAIAFALLALGSGAVLGYCKFYGKCALKRQQAKLQEKQSRALAEELVALYREGSQSELRKRLFSESPDKAVSAIRAIDNSIDASGKARVASLKAIASLSAEGLQERQAAQWADALRQAATSVLRNGPELSEFINQSYLLEGKRIPASR